jgi:hypothetical protein
MAQLRVLCLPGFGTNADFMGIQLKQLEKLKASHNVVFIPVDGPFAVPKEFVTDGNVLRRLKGGATNWRRLNSVAPHKSDLEMMAYLEQQLARHAPIHGLLGFSQGVMPVLKYLDSGRRVRCVILIGTINPPLETRIFDVPSLHIMGEEDPLFMEGVVLTGKFRDPQIMKHGYGHRLPFLNKRQMRELGDFIRGSEGAAL